MKIIILQKLLNQIVTLYFIQLYMYMFFQTVGTASLSVHVSTSLMSPNPFMSVLDSTLCCA